ncbi:MAG: hypothetical protein H7X97_14545 [Opitutaceae bacterium]|nr:hypothetical protein [Verrucomicrobiales bacterium]
MKRFIFLLLVCLFCTSRAPSSHCAPPPTRLLTASQELDDNVNRMELKPILPQLAELLGLKSEQVENALVERKISYSRLALLKLVADKSSLSLGKLLESTDPDPFKMLQSAQVSLDDATERLDRLYSDVALIRLHRRTPGQSAGRRQ